MYNYINIDLRNGADDVCSVYSIGRDNENLAAALRLFLPDKYLNCTIFFEFEIADGTKYTSKPLKFETEIVYPIQSFLMVEGFLKIAVTATDVTSKRVIKPFERTFVVSGAINALQNQGYEYTVAADHENRLSEVEANYIELKQEVKKTDVTNAYVDENGDLILTLADDVSDAYIDENGDLILVYEEEKKNGNT